MSMRRTAAAPSGSPLLAATKSTLDGRYGPSDRLCSADTHARSLQLAAEAPVGRSCDLPKQVPQLTSTRAQTCSS